MTGRREFVPVWGLKVFFSCFYAQGGISMNFQRFGGPWTEQKLAALERYLQAYLAMSGVL